MKNCGCEEFNTCKADKSCMYDFISVESVPELGTVVIEDQLVNEKVVICEEHIPELISVLQNITGVNKMEQWLVQYDDGESITKCLFNNVSAAENYSKYIEDIFTHEIKPTVRKVIVTYV